jgi:hypothetical protein
MSTEILGLRRLPDMLGWECRRPTVEECELVDRETSYAEPGPVFDAGDYVVVTIAAPDAQAKLAEALEGFGMCDAAHVIPAGVYLEE